MNERRHRPWLGGVCAALADRLGWNVYGIRAGVVLLAWFAPILTIASYLLGAWWLRRRRRPTRASDHPTLADWDARMAAIDREWERARRL